MSESLAEAIATAINNYLMVNLDDCTGCGDGRANALHGPAATCRDNKPCETPGEHHRFIRHGAYIVQVIDKVIKDHNRLTGDEWEATGPVLEWWKT